MKLGGILPKKFHVKEDKAQVFSFLAEEECALVAQRALSGGAAGGLGLPFLAQVEDVPGVVQSLGAVGPLDGGGRRF